MGTSEFVSVAEAAELLGCDPATVKRRIYRQALPAEKVGAVWVIRREHLDESAA